MKKKKLNVISINNSLNSTGGQNMINNFKNLTVFTGVNEVYEAHKQLSERLYQSLNEKTLATYNSTSLDESNRLIFAVKISTKEIYALRSHGKCNPTISNFICHANCITFTSKGDFSNPNDVKIAAEEALDAFNVETLEAIKLAKSQGRLPLILIEHIVQNKYIAYSIQEDILVLVSNFKTGKEDFYIKPFDSGKKVDFELNSKYTIKVPSLNTINKLDLNINPFICNKLHAWEEWQPRTLLPEKAIKDLEYTPMLTKDDILFYNKVVRYINLFRSEKPKKELYTLFLRIENLFTNYSFFLEAKAPRILLVNISSKLEKEIKKMDELLTPTEKALHNI